MADHQSTSKKHVPGSDARPEEIFTFPFLADEKTVAYITNHERVMFILRGLPGTGKTTLSSMIKDKYPSSVVCSADSYFSQAFVNKVRNKDSLKMSHNFCQKRVKEECQKDTHPIIVQNTHIKGWELNAYLDLASNYGYTVIFAITLRKFIIDPKVLEATNKKGLNENYFRIRMNQWQECIPLYLGWFLCPEDQSFVLEQTKLALSNILGDGKFCRNFDAYSEEEIWKYFNIEKYLFSVATFCNKGKEIELRKFYLSDLVQNVYGKCFTFHVLGFIVTTSYILAVTSITTEMKSLMLQKPSRENVKEESLEAMMGGLSVQNGMYYGMGKTTFFEKFSSIGKTAKFVDRSPGEFMNTKLMSFIVIACSGTKHNVGLNVLDFGIQFFEGIANSEGIVEDHSFSELDDGTKYCRLPNDAWLLPLEKKITLSSVFTGLYLT